jgi:hypothetical protein
VLCKKSRNFHPWKRSFSTRLKFNSKAKRNFPRISVKIRRKNSIFIVNRCRHTNSVLIKKFFFTISTCNFFGFHCLTTAVVVVVCRKHLWLYAEISTIKIAANANLLRMKIFIIFLLTFYNVVVSRHTY